MFYKLINLQKKTGGKTVVLIYRDSKGKEFQRSVGVSVKPAHFDTKTGKVSGKDAQNVEKNEAIAKVTRLFEAVERDLKFGNLAGHTWQFRAQLSELESDLAGIDEGREMLTTYYVSRTDTIRNQITRLEKLLEAKRAELLELEDISGTRQADNTHSFAEMLSKYHINQKQRRIKESTIKTYRSMGSIVNRFRPNLTVEEIDLAFLNDLQDYLIADGCRDNYTNIFFVQLKAFYKWVAEEIGLDIKFLKKFVPVSGGTDDNVIFLTESELKAFEELPITSTMQHKARELFLLACETGLRYSDYLFDKASIQSDTYVTETGEWVNGKVLKLETQKTEQKIAVPLSEKALAILERNNYQFNRPAEPNFNKALRAIGAKIPELQYDIVETYKVGGKKKTIVKPKYEALTSHVARKTFIDKAISKGASIMTVAQWVGHADIETIQKHYANKAELAKREAYKIL